MKTIGIIAEYNPFHNGHLYQINKIKEKYPDSIIIVILNGYFLERGEMSILSKEDKTIIALNNNVDIVIELPVLYGTQSADTFAASSIKLLNELHVDTLIFGSESNNINILEKIAKKQLTNNLEIKNYLSTGLNYPTALKKALNIDFDYNNPNDLLGISYIKEILKNNYNISYESIKRTNDYHDTKSNESIISAKNIREKINNHEDINKHIPYNISNYKINNNKEKLFELLKYQIISNNNLDEILDVDEGLDNKLKKEINNCKSIDELITKVKSKRYTYNKINRMLTHILLNIKKKDNKEIDYLKILGFSNKGKEYLNKIKKNINIDLYSNKLDSKTKKYELNASKIYDLINNTNTYKFELNNKPFKWCGDK